MSYYLLEDKPTRFEIWMDFGTKTAGEKTIMDGLSQLFTEQIQWDIQFQFKGGETVGAHVFILSAGSPVFAAMFRTDMVEAQTRRVTIENIERNVFWQLLIYLYTGSCPKVEDDNMTQLLFEAADMYDVETLKCECVDILLARLTVDNAVDLLIWAHLRSIPNLFELKHRWRWLRIMDAFFASRPNGPNLHQVFRIYAWPPQSASSQNWQIPKNPKWIQIDFFHFFFLGLSTFFLKFWTCFCEIIQINSFKFLYSN